MLNLTAWLANRLDVDSSIGDDEKLLVLAALEGDEALADMAGFTAPAQSTTVDNDVEPVGAYIRQISVEGFRGIGPRAQIELKPGAGLTIISGRNGSGKSSFAEALELAMTGTTYRWRDKRSTQWGDAWRNLHAAGPSRIEVTLVEETTGPTTLTVEWAEGAEREAADVWLQRHGKKREAGRLSLGWTDALEMYRPLLTYEELGGLLSAEPSKLHDALSTVLGLEAVTAAVKRLENRSKELTKPGAELALEKKSLIALLQNLDDERAIQAAELLSAKLIDTPRILALATGTNQTSDGIEGQLKVLLNLSLPADEETLRAAATLRETVEQLANESDAAAEALERRTSLLRDAISVHAHEGDVACPVCSTGRLDDAWASRAQAQVNESAESLNALAAAKSALASARAAARDLISPLPGSLSTANIPGLIEQVSAATDAWTKWAELPTTDLQLSAHLELALPPAQQALAELHLAARQLLNARDDEWASVAGRLASYATAAASWAAAKPDADTARSAVKWLKENDVILKNERLLPIAERAREIWAKLRQESNVEIAGLTLAGTATRRRVEIVAAVDGNEAAGLAVMSQGELHALALALFLPRATMSESPFRFVIFDDPVQAMDPAKVDGLVDVLSHAAQHRQIVVFSHDDRLAHAVRRASVDATILEVTRAAGSKAKVVNAFDPPRRYLRDADAMVRDVDLPEATLRRILPGMLRFAAEAQARDVYYAAALSDGLSHSQVERTWTDTHKTAHRVSLAIYGEIRSLDAWLGKHAYRKRALGICTTAAHNGLHGQPKEAIEDVESFVRDIRNGTK